MIHILTILTNAEWNYLMLQVIPLQVQHIQHIGLASSTTRRLATWCNNTIIIPQNQHSAVWWWFWLIIYVVKVHSSLITLTRWTLLIVENWFDKKGCWLCWWCWQQHQQVKGCLNCWFLTRFSVFCHSMMFSLQPCCLVLHNIMYTY